MANDYLSIARVANQQINATTWTDITWDTEVSDTAGYFTLAAPTKLLTVPASKAGKFLITTRAIMSGSTNRCLLQYTLFNSSNTQLREVRMPLGYQDNYGTNTAEFTLAVGDYIIFNVWIQYGDGNRGFVANVEMFRIGS